MQRQPDLMGQRAGIDRLGKVAIASGIERPIAFGGWRIGGHGNDRNMLCRRIGFQVARYPR